MKNFSLAIAAIGLSAVPFLAHGHEENFEDRVRNYILRNPEVILEALEVLSQREARAATLGRLEAFPELFADPARLGEGDAAAPVRVVEFFDYKCVPCKTIHPDIVAFTDANPDVRVEMRHLPILTPGSERAARFALATEAAFGAEAYRAVHDQLWEVRGPLNAAGFQRITDALGLDYAQIAAGMESEAISARIDYNRDVAIALEVLGTPAFVTTDNVTFGTTDIDALAQTWLSQ